MDGHFQLKVLRPDLDEDQCNAVIRALVDRGVPEDQQFHDDLGREAEAQFPFGPGVIFLSKQPHDTLWLQLSYPDNAAPTDLLRDMATVGWTWQAGLSRAEGLDPLAPQPLAPPFGGRVEVDICCKGSGLFGAWTPQEKTRHLRQIRRVLRKHGFIGVPHHKLTLADLL